MKNREEKILEILSDNGYEMNVGDLLDAIKDRESSEEMGKSLTSVFGMLATGQVVIIEDNDSGRLIVHSNESTQR